MRFLTLFLIFAVCAVVAASQPPSNDAAIEANKKLEAENAAVRDALNKGLAAFAAKNYDEAIIHFEKGIAVSVANRPIFRKNKALALNARAVARYNSSFRLSDAAGKNQAIESAKSDWKAAAETINTAATEAKAAYGRGAKPITDILELRAEIMGLIVSVFDPSQLKAAESAYQEFFEVQPDQAARLPSHVGFGKMLFQVGHYENAAVQFEAAFRISPDNVEVVYGLGTSLIGAQKDLQRSANLLNRFLQLAPATHSRRPDAKAALDYLKEVNITPK